jgi:beta-glucosidase
MPFPPDFVWGAATSSYQIEGAPAEDGKGPSIWDTFSHVPGHVANGDTGDVAADHYHRWADDVDLIADLGLNAYRFSISWPRIQPHGRGPANTRGVDFYRRLVDRLRERGIAPVATLYHWDLPQALQDAGGGWLNRDTTERFAEYAGIVFRALDDGVALWITHNEPWCTAALGHRLGIHAPGVTDVAAELAVSHHVLLSHGLAVEAYRGTPLTAPIGIALNLMPTYPAAETDGDRSAAVLSDGYTNRWYLDPVLTGSYPADMLELWDRLVGPLPEIGPDDAASIGTPSDFLGVNYYARRVIGAGTTDDGLPWRVMPVDPRARRTDTGWEVTPDALFDLLVRLRADYGEVPILIAENGAVFFDEPNPDGRTFDHGRSEFIGDHLLAVHRAIAAGVPVAGYFAWSLLDNFEWAEGFRSRFGLVHVDYPTGRRLIKESGRAYAGIVAANAVAEPEPQRPADAGVPG